MTKPLGELAAEILEDGVIDAAEVQRIRERIYADNIIDREEGAREAVEGAGYIFDPLLTKSMLGIS